MTCSVADYQSGNIFQTYSVESWPGIDVRTVSVLVLVSLSE